MSFHVTAYFPAPLYDPTRPAFDFENDSPLRITKVRKVGREFEVSVDTESPWVAEQMTQAFKGAGAGQVLVTENAA